ncbi:MAG: TRAP transporter substrate-binding protein DctP [Thermodesulfobacteriota bacterium]
MFGTKTMKRLVMLGMVAVGVLGTVPWGFAAPQTINCISAWPKTAFETSNLLTYIDMVQKEADSKSPGELKIVFKGGPDVVHTNEQVEALRTGVVDLVLSAPSYYVSVMPEGDLMSLTELKPWEEKAAGVFKYLDELHNKKVNAHYLGRPGTGVLFQLFLNKPIKTVADLKGMKIRVSPTNVPFMKAVGATPVQMPPSDVYTAMERGVVDGYILPAHTIRDFGLVKPSKYIVFPGAYQPCHSLLVNLDKWKKLSRPLQDVLTKNADAITRVAFFNIDQKIKEEYDSFKKEGMQFIQLPPAEAEKYVKIARDAMFEVVSKKAPVESEKILKMIIKKK